MAKRLSPAVQGAALLAAGALLVAFLVIPLLALGFGMSLEDLASGLSHPVVWPALRLSLLTTSVSLLLVVTFGLPLAWTVARHRGVVARVVETAVQLPIVVPPAVAGVALLFAFGRHGLFAGWLYPHGWSVTFTTGAVILAEMFVSAPFFFQAAVNAFRGIEENTVIVARSFGARPFPVVFGLAVPLVAPSLVAGAAMSWARSLGEFGATLMFAGNLRGETQTLPLAIYVALESDVRAARALALLLVSVALVVLLIVRAAVRRSTPQNGLLP